MAIMLYLAALLAPAAISALPWDGAAPTQYNAAEIDYWSPAPTAAPKLTDDILNMFRKRQQENADTCGYEGGNQTLSLTCNDVGYVCATNSRFAVHGCCNPSSINSCTLPTTCYASSQLASCTGDCASNVYNTLCSGTVRPSCYEWLYDYGSTTMTEHGCAATGFTIAVSRFFDGENTSAAEETSQLEVPISTRYVTVTAGQPSSTNVVGAVPATLASTGGTPAQSTTTNGGGNSASDGGSSTPVGAIVGGVVGGVVAIGAAIAVALFFFFRHRKQSRLAATTATPAPGASTGAPQNDHKPAMQGVDGANSAWQQNQQYGSQYPQGQGQYPPQGQHPQSQYPQGPYDPHAAAAAAAAPAGYYQPGQEQKAAYLASGPQPYSPPHSPPPAHGQVQQVAPIQQLDSTPIAHPNPAGAGAGREIHEAP